MSDPWPRHRADPGSQILGRAHFLAELCQVVASNTELQPILDWIVQKTTGLLAADEGSIKLLGADTGPPTAKTLIRKHRPGLDSGSWQLADRDQRDGLPACTRASALASPDLLDDDRFPGSAQAQSRVRSVLAVPLRGGQPHHRHAGGHQPHRPGGSGPTTRSSCSRSSPPTRPA